jgi:thiamine pyrophosphokinase
MPPKAADMAHFDALIVTNGFNSVPGSLTNWIDSATTLIAVDGGANILHAAGLTPDLLVGDMDSIEPPVLEHFRTHCEVVEHPITKDETDTELALHWCSRQGLRRVLVANPLNGRFDQALSMIALLEYASELGLYAEIQSDTDRLLLVAGSLSDSVLPNTRVSLIPLSGTVENVVTNGLRYPLRSETLYRSHTRGISNETTGIEFSVTHGTGTLLAIINTE